MKLKLKRLYKLTALLFAVVFVLASCKKSKGEDSSKKDTTKYVNYEERVSPSSLIDKKETRFFSVIANGSQDEIKYIAINSGSEVLEGHRFADKSAYFAYGFGFEGDISDINIVMDIAGQYRVDVSQDGVLWESVMMTNEISQRVSLSATLSDILGKPVSGFYLRFSDAVTSDGFGPSIHAFEIEYSPENAETDKGPKAIEALSGEGAKPKENENDGNKPPVKPTEKYDIILSFNANGNDTEKKYIFKDNSTGIFDDSHRFADKNDYWIYCFTFPEKIAKGIALFEVSGQYKIEYSLDSKNWTSVASILEGAEKDSITLNLATALKSNTVLYLKFSDSKPADEFGVGLHKIQLSYNLSSGAKNKMPEGYVSDKVTNTFTHKADGSAAELKFIYQNSGTDIADNDHRFADENAFWSYAYVFESAVSEVNANFDIGGQYEVSVSGDGQNWEVLKKSTDASPRGNLSIELTKYVKKTGQGNYLLYIKIADAVKFDGFGGSLWSVTLKYTNENGKTGNTPTGAVKNSYKFSTKGNAEELLYMKDDSSSGIGDGGNRFADEKAYWIYAMRFENKLQSLSLILDMDGQYKVSASVNGKDWKTVCYSDESKGRMDVTASLDSIVKGNNMVYLKFEDYKTADGFGVSLWNLSLSWVAEGFAKEGKPQKGS